jgi:cytosine/adenosine deaminase-related metal-dependent hydrolase
MLTTLSLIASFASFPLLSPAQQSATILAPDAIVAADGQLLEGYKVVIVDGKIIEVAADPRTAGIEVRLHGVLSPGFVDTFAQLGAEIFLTEQSDKVTPGLLAVDGARLGSDVWQELAKHGVTSAHLVPDPTNVLSGSGALIATASEASVAKVTDGQTVQIASLLSSSVSDGRVGPSSLAGALEVLHESVAAHGARALGSLPWFFVEDAAGTRSVKTLMSDLNINSAKFILLGDPGEYAGLFTNELVGLPAFGMGELARRAELWRRMSEANISVAFGTRMSNTEYNSLRSSAMAWSRITRDPQAAFESITVNPATMLGRDDIGRIAKGARADLVLWSAHPLDAQARVLATMIAGETVYRADISTNN